MRRVIFRPPSTVGFSLPTRREARFQSLQQIRIRYIQFLQAVPVGARIWSIYGRRLLAGAEWAATLLRPPIYPKRDTAADALLEAPTCDAFLVRN